MRKFIIAAALAGTTLFSGCTTGSITPTVVVTDVQQATVALCAFLPTALTVANIIAAGNPALATATEIATAICAAVTPKAAIRNGAVPMVGGVPVAGRFVH